MKAYKRKVLIVVNYFYPYMSGVSEYARSVAKTLAGEHDVTVLTGRHRRDLPLEEQIDGYNIIRASPLVFLNKGYVSFRFIRLFIQLAKESDIVNIHFPMLECGLLAALTDKPIVLTYQCDMAPAGDWFSRLAVRAVQASGRFGLGRAQAVPVLSLDYANSSPILATFKRKLIEIRPPNRFGSEVPTQQTTTCAEKSRAEPLTCGFVGRFVEEKGIGNILDAALNLAGEDIVFWLAGDYESIAGGGIFPALKSRIDQLGDKVKLFGKLNDKDLAQFYSNIDILLLPSVNRFEAFGMVQMEAMEFGAMVVTSDMPGVRDVVKKTGMGELCTPGSTPSLVSAILKAAARRATTERYFVRQKLHEEFPNNEFNNSYLDLIEKLTDKAANS